MKSASPTKAYSTHLGAMWCGSIESALEAPHFRQLKGKVNLIFTSPPYPLLKKKKYGNREGEEYLGWLSSLAPRLAALLAPTGSIVLELGNAWNPGQAEMSTLPLRSLLAFQEAGSLILCQHLIWHNPARLPGPAQWVTIERTRLKDSFTHLWWLAKTPVTKANNSRVLMPYSKHMKSLLREQTYNSGKRPSGHVLSKRGFLANRGGAISPSVISTPENGQTPESLVSLSNTNSDSEYTTFCIEKGLQPHPARMPITLAAFMVQFLTEPDDLVLDPFAGSNVTGAACESLGRRWVGVEASSEYVNGSRARFIGSILGRPKCISPT